MEAHLLRCEWSHKFSSSKNQVVESYNWIKSVEQQAVGMQHHSLPAGHGMKASWAVRKTYSKSSAVP